MKEQPVVFKGTRNIFKFILSWSDMPEIMEAAAGKQSGAVFEKGNGKPDLFGREF